MSVSVFWMLDLRRMGSLLHTHDSTMASPAISDSSSWLRVDPVAPVYTSRWRTDARGSTRHCFFLCILGLLSCIWGIVVWVLGVLFGGLGGFLLWGFFFCMRGVTLYLGSYCILGGSFVSWVFDGGFLLNLGFYCIMGDYFVSWVLDGGLYWVLFYYGGTLYLRCLLGGFYCFLGFMWVLGVVSM